MRKTLLANLLALGPLFFAMEAFPIEPGSVVFSDGFEATGTFAENWISSRAKSADGVLRLMPNGSVKTRIATPVEFVCDVDITFDAKWAKVPADGNRGWGGIILDPFYSFAIKPDGTTFLVWRLSSEKRSSGTYLKIPGYAKGQSVHLQVVRKRFGEGVKYLFYVDGRASGDFLAPMPKLVKGEDGRESYDAPRLFAYREEVEFDNFQLAEVRHDDDSPNMITNSGFEHDEDGVPPYYCLQGQFNWAKCDFNEYENTYLKRFCVDTSEKHSGRQSLRVRIDKTATSTQINPWAAGTLMGKPGVFSVWMKSSSDALPVSISYGSRLVGKRRDGHRTVAVGREWRRYEVTCESLPGKGTYSPVSIRIENSEVPECTLWIDDLQAETVVMPEGGFAATNTYATVWKASEKDRSAFGAQEDQCDAKPAPIAVPKLSKGLKPSADIDAWKGEAAVVNRFYNAGKDPSLKTDCYLACDDDNLYVGYRLYGDLEKNARTTSERRDAGGLFSKDSIELLFTPYGGEDRFHFGTDHVGNLYDKFADDLSFDGRWSSACIRGEGFTDMLVTLPLENFAASGLRDKWGFNLCRNMTGASGMEWVCTAKTKRCDFGQVDAFREMTFPAGVLDKFRTGAEIPPYGLHKAENNAAAGARRILGRLDFYMNEPEARFRVWEADGSMHEENLDITKMPCGTNKVTVAGLETTVVKLPYWKGATQINRWTRSLVHDGRKVFPTGIFLGSTASFQTDKHALTNLVDFLAARGIRQAMPYCRVRWGFLRDVQNLVRYGATKGIDYVIWGSPYFVKPTDRDNMTKEEFVREYAFNNTLSMLVIDEPELYMTSEETRRQLVEMKKCYPYTPVQMNNTRMGIPQRFVDLQTDILMLDDYLANGPGRNVWSVVRQVPIMLDAGAADGKPPHFFIEGGVVSLHFKAPTYAEQVAQSWGCIAAGCTGIWWYEDFPTVEGAWRAMMDVNREVQSLVEPLLSEEICEAARSDIDREKVISLTKTLNGDWYVFSCNLDPKDYTVTYTLPKDAPRDGTVEVLFENRTLKLKSGRFTDAYAPLQRHVYRVK